MTEKAQITGWKRNRKTKTSVKVGEVVSRSFITLGGIGTIIAVSTIFVFLVGVVLPLFGDAEIGAPTSWDLAALSEDGRAPTVSTLRVDEAGLLGWALLDDRELVAFEVATGVVLQRSRPFGERVPTTLDVTLDGEHVAAGFEDGSIQLGTLHFAIDFMTDGAPEELLDLEIGASRPWGESIVFRTPEDQLRRHALEVSFDEPATPTDGSAVVRLDHTVSSRGTIVAQLTADGTLGLSRVRLRRNMLTGETTASLTTTELPMPDVEAAGPPSHVRVSGLGDSVYVAWDDGRALRFSTFDFDAPTLEESVDLIGPGGALTSLEFMIGGTTLVAGSSAGDVGGWFPAIVEGGDGGRHLVRAHTLAPHPASLAAVGASLRTRSFVVGHDDGTLRLMHMTSDRELARVSVPDGAPVELALLAPRDDGLLAVAGGQLHRWPIDNPHPESALSSMFGKVWYEGDAGPTHTWQSTGGEDAFEPKLGLMPLVFGTLKGTFYAMLFGVPLSLLAAIYSSEFMAKRARARVKQVIEMMASLPSVVLGFLAALWLANVVERVVPATIVAFVTVPLTWLVGAYLWQLLPRTAASRLAGVPRLAAIAVCIPIGAYLAGLLGPAAERLLFGGDIVAWLDVQHGTAHGGWTLIFLPLSAILVMLMSGRYVTPWIRSISAGWSHSKVALVDLVRFVACVAASLAVAWGVGFALQALGADPRTGPTIGTANLAPLGTYVQRNSLIVGFVMGFAIIPIIYTLAEDALSAVPDHLRAASLATGATKWQTAVRVVVPTATSGLFSAIMIGLGRAVGETMIVLMAAGNTPIMEANLFNGFRTLSATIAVELPEAVKSGTLYRVLFLSALTLFAMTFVINTLAEVVRLRFRKKAVEL